jgi:phage-related protein|nr:MAG TPA: minor tail protein [Caudoviricetes sp.]
MAQADGSIIIDTEINSDGMSAGGREIESSLRKMANELNGVSAKTKASIEKQIDSFSKLSREYARQSEKVEELKRKVAEYGNQKIPTEEYREIQTQIDQATAKMNQLTEAQERFLANGGKKNSNTYKKQQYDIDELANTIKYAEGELKDLEASGTAFRTGTGTKEAKSDMEKLAAAEDKLANINDRLNTSYKSIKGTVDEYKSKTLKASDANDKMSSSGKRASKSIKGVSKSAGGARMSLGRMLGMSLLMSVAFRAFSAVMSGIKGGFDNLSQYSSDTNNSLSMLWSSLVRLQNSLATAFAPILSIVAPILSKFIDMISTAASYVSMFFAFLSGKKTYTKAIAVQKDYAKSLDKTASSAKKDADSTKDVADATEDATDATEDYLSPLDDLNRYTEQQDKNNSGSKNPSSSTPNTGGGSGTSPMFEEVAISDIPILEKLKDILSKIFKPFKEAWDKEGQNTIDSAKYAFTELKNLVTDVGKSMLEVWTNGTGTKILETILQITQGIFTTIGNVARQLDVAWNKNKVGTAIIQAIADIFQTILDIINKIVWATADWAEKLDFYPLLDSIRNVLEKLQPLIKVIGDYVYELYTTIVLPFLKWLIEKGLPTLINGIAGFFDFLSKHSWIIELIGSLLIGAFAAGKITPLIAMIVNGISGLISILGSEGLIGAISAIISSVGIIPIVITAVIAILVLLATHWDQVKQTMLNFADWLNNAFVTDWTRQFGIIGDYMNLFFSTISNIIDGIKQIFNGIVEFFTGVFTGNWKQAWEGIKDIFIGVWNLMATIVTTPLNLIKTLVNQVFEFIEKFVLTPFSKFVNGIFKTDWTQAFGIIGDYMNGWAQNIKNIFDSVKQIFNGIVNFVNGVLSGNWRRAWNGIKNIFAGIWNAMASLIKSPVNLIISFMNAMLRGFQRMQNGFASAMNHMNIRLPKWLQEFTGWSSVGFNIGYWSPNYIPYLAKGAVIPPNKEFMAVLGDQKNGNNIEAPENLIRQIVREESGGGQKQRIEIPVYLKGKQIYKAVVEEGKVVMSQTGMNPFEMA